MNYVTYVVEQILSLFVKDLSPGRTSFRIAMVLD